MFAFHNDLAVKEKYLSRVRAHRAADNLIRGTGWENGKGCAVGCTLENYDHSAYEKELGIPEWLARVEDTLFEGMTEEKSKTWPELFLAAIPVGANIETVKTRFIVILLEHTLKSMDAVKYDKAAWPDAEKAIAGSKAAVQQMIEAQKSGDWERILAAAWSAESHDYYADQLLELLKSA